MSYRTLGTDVSHSRQENIKMEYFNILHVLSSFHGAEQLL